jgi:inosose dehydratase
MKQSRRQYLAATGAAALVPALTQLLPAADTTDQPRSHIATNSYPWLTFARRAGQVFSPHADQLLADIASTGIVGYEPIITEVTEFHGLADRLRTHGLTMKSIYVNSTLHDEARAEQSVSEVIKIARAAQDLGTRVVVTNPSPIRWGGPEDKSDKELRLQATTLDHLGHELRKLGMTLAYHNHDAELRQGGREFHHMLTATNPDNVKLCLDAHWIFRGCGDSEVAVFDALAHYHQRIVELHLRQSVHGVWTEDFRMNGDVDYVRLFEFLERKEIVPHLVLEQAVEEKSPRTLSVVAAHRLGCDHLKQFA